MRKSKTVGMTTSGMNLVAAGGNAHPCTFPNFFFHSFSISLLLFFGGLFPSTQISSTNFNALVFSP